MAGFTDEQVLQHIKTAHAALDIANSDRVKLAAQQQEVAGLIPQVVEALVAHDRIEPGAREKAASLLKDPVQALKILLKTANTAMTVRAQALGAPDATPVKQASTRPGYTGAPGSSESPADVRFREAILGR